MPVETQGGNTRGKSLDYFNVSAFPELVEAYGQQPKRLMLVLPHSDIESVFQSEWQTWGKSKKRTDAKGKKIRQCDGETCVFHLDKMVLGEKYGKGQAVPCICKEKELDTDHKEHCASRTVLVAYVVSPKTGMLTSALPYRFETGSVGSAEQVFTELQRLSIFTQQNLFCQMLLLEVRMHQGEKEGKATNFPLWHAQPPGDVMEIQRIAKNGNLPVTPANAVSFIYDEDQQIAGVASSDPVIAIEEPKVVATLEETREKIKAIGLDQAQTKTWEAGTMRWGLQEFQDKFDIEGPQDLDINTIYLVKLELKKE
jgi:hypothetical protein